MNSKDFFLALEELEEKKGISKEDFIKYIENLDEKSFKEIRISLQNGEINRVLRRFCEE